LPRRCRRAAAALLSLLLRCWLFERATGIDEHFGIVPLEAMAAARPVVAVGLGGPCESVVHGTTGWLCEPSAAAFADAFEDVRTLQSDAMLEGRGAAARTHVEGSFGLPAFGKRLEAHLRALCE